MTQVSDKSSVVFFAARIWQQNVNFTITFVATLSVQIWVQF